MLRTILVGLDGSKYSEAAIELGIRWAGQCDGLLVGLAIIDEPDIRRPQAVPMGAGHFKQEADEAHLKNARRKVEEFLDHFITKCTAANVAAKPLEDIGNPYERIILEAQRYNVVLLGKQTYFHFETQDDACDTLHQVLNHAPRPVVAVPEPLTDRTATLIAYDGSLQAARAVQAFACSGPTVAGPIHIISVAEDKVEAARRADRAAEFLAAHDIKSQTHPLSTHHPAAEVLCREADRLEAGLIVMGTYGQPKLREFFLGSVTREMLEATSVPLFLFH